VLRVSVVLPTFNRARFLLEAFGSIKAQTLKDWECIVVDDGSTDETEAIVRDWTRTIGQPVLYVRQTNQGAYGARNTGLDHASGEYIAFFDSDDLWLPEHLERCVSALEAIRDADWIFAACRSVDPTGHVVQASTFETASGPLPFLSLRTRTIGGARLIVDPEVVECHLKSGLYAGLQNSVIRRTVFDGYRFWPDYRVVEDAHFLLRALLRGIRLAYLPDVHVIYRIHDGNSSGSATGISRQSLYNIKRENIVGLERMKKELTFTPGQRRAVNICLSRHYFWSIGYVCCWEAGDVPGAFTAFRRALQLNPWDLSMWKTYLFCLVKSALSLQPREASSKTSEESRRMSL
jgi:glycosyltransferase involved in cell wall biosynthesis